eukprot:12414664-Karenia_brevis.AAC.1
MEAAKGISSFSFKPSQVGDEDWQSVHSTAATQFFELADDNVDEDGSLEESFQAQIDEACARAQAEVHRFSSLASEAKNRADAAEIKCRMLAQKNHELREVIAVLKAKVLPCDEGLLDTDLSSD